MRRVLVLRPEPGASETVRKARERGVETMSIPLFEIEPVEWSAPDAAGFDGLLLTSANAVRHGGEQLQKVRALKVYAIGEATALAARDAGFEVAATGEAGIDRLLDGIAPDLNLLHLGGADRRLPPRPRQRIISIVAYRAKPAPAPDLSAAPGSVVLIHSPRAGKRFAELVSERDSTVIVAISPAAAEAVGAGWEGVEAAEHPTDDALLALAARLCDNPQPK